MAFFGINQSKNQSSASATSDSSYHSSDQNSRNTDASTNLENSSQVNANASYDSHNAVTAGQGSTVNVTEDAGIVANALDTVKQITLGLAGAVGLSHGGGASGGDSHYDAPAAASKIPTAVYIVGALVGVLIIAGVVIVATKKR